MQFVDKLVHLRGIINKITENIVITFTLYKKNDMKKKIKKSTGLTVALLIYVSLTAAYFLPRNTEISASEKYITVGVSYLIVLLLWLVLRKKEALQQKRKDEAGY